MQLAEWLRAEPGRTKSALARAVGVKWRAIHRIARGERSPSLTTALAIERATCGEVSAAELVRTSSTLATNVDSASPGHAEDAA